MNNLHGFVLEYFLKDIHKLENDSIYYGEKSLDKFIEQKLKEGGISLQEQSRVHVNVNPNLDYVIKEGEKALLIP